MGDGPGQFCGGLDAGETLPEADPETLEFFLLERYCLYAAQGERLYRAYIHHRPWPLCQATLSQLSSTMLAVLEQSTQPAKLVEQIERTIETTEQEAEPKP